MTVDATLSQITIPSPLQTTLGAEGIREALHVALEVAVVGEELDVGTIDLDAAGSLLLEVLVAAKGGEAPVLGDNDLLATGELVLRAAEGLEGESAVWDTG
jgi:hypothetical protein